jgi:MerR family transcriptional regulator, light-induced transcriptional regulator
MDELSGYLRIGELSRRTGVSPELLRAWETRYHLLEPTRSSGGFRLYSDQDERRVRVVTRLIAEGVSAAEAARQALDQAVPSRGEEAARVDEAPLIDALRDQLTEAFRSFDTTRANEVLDRAFAAFTIESSLRDLLLPYLRSLGDRWERGDATVAEEHAASNLIRGRLLGFTRGWGALPGSGVVVACPPGEWHDLGAIAFGIVAARRGRRVTYLGPNSPYRTIEDAARAVDAEVVVLAVTDPQSAELDAEAIREIAATTRVAIGGVSAVQARELGAEHLPGDPVTAAIALGPAASQR